MFLSLFERLQRLFPQSSKNGIRAWIKEGRVYVEGKESTNPLMVVEENQNILLLPKTKRIRPNLPILYEDADLIVIDKPSGLLTVATFFEKEETAEAILQAYYPKRTVYVVHRLDQEASGALVFAFNPVCYDRLKELFAAHALQRCYTAIVEGKFPLQTGSWKSYQKEDRSYRVHDDADPSEGRIAISHYRCLASSKRYSHLEITLETGRKNQIRVHCQSAGHPIAGDKKYGATSNPLKRICLHAHLLSFQHPMINREVRIESPIPDPFFRLVD